VGKKGDRKKSVTSIIQSGVDFYETAEQLTRKQQYGKIETQNRKEQIP
jgi:hypothetical protein